MKSKQLMEYLNSIDATVETKHQEFKIEQYNLSVVLFKINTTTSNGIETKYKVNIIADKDDSNLSWHNIRCELFDDEQKAIKHYDNLIKLVSQSDKDVIKQLLQD